MNLSEYEQAVIDLLRSGRATDAELTEMAKAVAFASERGCTPMIDNAIGVDDEEVP